MSEETNLEMARRHVRQGAARVVQQYELMVELCADGRLTEAAERLFANLQDSQQQYNIHLARLESRCVRRRPPSSRDRLL